jgi:hypothetical protein
MSDNKITGRYLKQLQSQKRKDGNKAAAQDLENQILSQDPLQRLRQLDQQEADRIERTTR